MPPLPPCETTGLINLCAPALVINWPSWFYIQVPNVIWFGLVLLLLVLGIFLPFPAREIDTTGYDVPKGE
ncbi:MAG: hypothetical protein U0822_03020 [Anaerolineae bacterium]